MSSALITALLIGAVLVIITGFVVSVFFERRHSQQGLAQQQSLVLAMVQPRVMAVLHPQNGIVFSVEQPASVQSPSQLPPSVWYTRRRTLVSLVFLIMVLLTLFVQSGLADGALQNLSKTFTFLSATQSSDYQTAAQAQAQAASFSASQRIVRVDSASAAQYYNSYQLNVWSWSSCSGIAMEEVMNAYGKHLIASDVLQVEQNLGVWDSYDGLTGGEQGIAETAAYFGFKALPNPPRTLDALIATANKGFPVIVGIPGHILDVRGGDSTYVYLVDSAPADRTFMTHAEFMSLWNGFSVVLVPR